MVYIVYTFTAYVIVRVDWF